MDSGSQVKIKGWVWVFLLFFFLPLFVPLKFFIQENNYQAWDVGKWIIEWVRQEEEN